MQQLSFFWSGICFTRKTCTVVGINLIARLSGESCSLSFIVVCKYIEWCSNECIWLVDCDGGGARDGKLIKLVLLHDKIRLVNTRKFCMSYTKRTLATWWSWYCDFLWKIAHNCGFCVMQSWRLQLWNCRSYSHLSENFGGIEFQGD